MVNFPESVPVFTSRKLCKGKYYDRNKGTRCASGWISYLFFQDSCSRNKTALHIRMRYLFMRCCESRVKVYDYYVELFNDKSPKTKIAEGLNRFMALLGYTEGNPESQWAKENYKRLLSDKEKVKYGWRSPKHKETV